MHKYIPFVGVISCAGMIVGCADSTPQTVQNSPVVTSVTNQQQVPTQKGKWSLVWHDEFNGSKVDESKWQFEENCWGGGNDEQQCYVKNDQNAFVDQGVLTLRAIKQQTTGPATPQDWNESSATKTLPYSSARLRTKDRADWQYGRFEVRAKMPQGQGTWPAVWMLPSDFVYGGWAASGEIDIVEAVNLHTTYQDEAGNIRPENRVHGTLHYGKNWPNNVSSGTEYTFGNDEINPADDFHTYAIEWEKGEIRWYVDEVHYATQTQAGWWTQYQNDQQQWVSGPDDAPFNQKFHLLLNLAIGGSWAGETNDKGIDPNLERAEMQIDYVRVYQCSANTKTGQGCSSPVNPDAIQNTGTTEPPLTSAQVMVGTDKLEVLTPLGIADGMALSGWDNQSNDQRQWHDGELDIHIINQGNAYIGASNGTLDLSGFSQGKLVIEMAIVNNDADGLAIKLDSGWPNVAQIDIDNNQLASLDQWKRYEFPIASFKSHTKGFDLASIVNAVVFEPINGRDMKLKVRSISLEK
ncbi:MULTISPECIES: glycoside hydrolase family 16 protein [unclassified Vibrio]|uniref:Glycoside hydrolase family 16 protein n=1 Tax=Vibrio sp. HB236076 TaxID=3232307 RepID=A0AB39HKN8_9VIBR|nr:glycoside hydrolase family 16 protein [Vibrio sp. HB161653]MDP5252718.1 glycoside hydrolase family 16 protein [Vibrio sp. HB161653]